MSAVRNRKTETVVYAVLWMLAAGLFMLDMMRGNAQTSRPLLDAASVISMLCIMTPFFVLFLINNAVLMPRLLLRNRFVGYFAAVTALVVMCWVYQYFNFVHRMELFPPGGPPVPHNHLRPLLPLPLLLDFTYALFVLGVNIAICLMFQHYYDRLEHESLMKADAENRLSYLKAQINPHFYMNMLNNIHGMIEINPEKAQAMVIDMSQLMRYMLYESPHHRIALSDEIAFLRNYLNLMRLRFPDNKVEISVSFPDAIAMAGSSLPPLLFLVFIENAFKHGVSYLRKSFIRVSLTIDGGRLKFCCENSCSGGYAGDDSRDGIGLRNVRQRLALIYGADATLDIRHTDSLYSVNLNIPAYETENDNNR